MAYHKKKQSHSLTQPRRTFWWCLHHINSKLREGKHPTNKMPNLGYLLKFKLGTHETLESLLHNRVLDYIQILKAPTTHKYHWTQKAHWL